MEIENIESNEEMTEGQKTFLMVLTAFCLGALLAVIGLNMHAHSMIKDDPSISLTQYWDGE